MSEENKIKVKTQSFNFHGTKLFFLRNFEPHEDQPSIVLLHGASFTAKTWAKIGLLKALDEAQINFIALDLPGFGDSEKSTVAPKEFLSELFSTLKIQAPFILSASMSGQYALPYTLSPTQGLSGLIAVAPVAIPKYINDRKSIDNRLLAIWGENDKTIPIDHAKQLARAFNEKEIVIIKEGSHAPYMSRPNVFNKLVIKFILNETD